MNIFVLNGDTFESIFLTLFIIVFMITVVGMAAFFRIESLLTKGYPEQHNKIFGKHSFSKYSVSRSIKTARFLLSKKEWRFIQEDKTIAWLKLYRILLLLCFSITFPAMVYVFIAVIIQLKQNGSKLSCYLFKVKTPPN